MDWSNERYVRVYTRDTADLLAVGWEGRAIWWELLRKCDRAGVIDTGGDLAVMAELLRLPVDVWERGFPRIVARDMVEVTDSAIVIPNFEPAQETAQSDAQRKRRSRERRRSEARQTKAPGVTKTDSMESPFVTTKSENGTAESQGVGGQSQMSLRAVPCRAVPIELTSPSARHELGQRQPPKPATSSEQTAIVHRVLGRLSELTGRTYRPTTQEHAKRVLGLLRKGHSEGELLAVVEHKYRQWGDDPKMCEYLRPSTLFGPQKFAEYLPAATATPRSFIREHALAEDWNEPMPAQTEAERQQVLASIRGASQLGVAK